MVFSKNVISDVLSFDSLKSCNIRLMDINGQRLEVAAKMAESINHGRNANAKIEMFKDRRAALEEADYVINTTGVGGFEATKRDLLIPDKKGLRQTIGDTLGIGGIFRTVRSLPVVLNMCREMEDVCPDALLINYTNPVAMHCLGIQRTTKVNVVGLCHGVRYTRARMIFMVRLVEMGEKKAREALADWTPEENRDSRFWKIYSESINDTSVNTLAAGINHMAAFLVFEKGGKDLYPVLHKALDIDYIRNIDPVRLELMKRFGYFMTETSGHIAEYLPWFMKSKTEIERMGLKPLNYLQTCEDLEKVFQKYKDIASKGESFIKPNEPVSIEYISRILNAIETGQSYVFNGNVYNGKNLISNLPSDCCVEVPCLADGNGIQPTSIGNLPPQCAAMMKTNINVQDLAVRGILEGKREHIYHAAMLDPNTAATLTLPVIEELVDEMFEAHGELIPQNLRQ